MEKRLTRKVDEHSVAFKKAIQTWLSTEKCSVTQNESGKDCSADFLEFIFEHSSLCLSKEDFQKRKRVKNIVPYHERCCAKRANSEQCTRRKKDHEEYCGTHSKGTPHGIIQHNEEEQNPITKIQVWVEEIKGINYYIDSNNNVYSHEDVLQNKNNPGIIAKWKLNEQSQYCIPEFES